MSFCSQWTCAIPLDTRIILRPMSLADVPLLDLWDRQPHVMAATSDDPDQPKAFGDTYWPDELALVGPDCQYLVAELDGRPIGAMQIIDPHTEATHYWGEIEPNLRAIDIWIGAAEDPPERLRRDDDATSVTDVLRRAGGDRHRDRSSGQQYPRPQVLPAARLRSRRPTGVW